MELQQLQESNATGYDEASVRIFVAVSQSQDGESTNQSTTAFIGRLTGPISRTIIRDVVLFISNTAGFSRTGTETGSLGKSKIVEFFGHAFVCSRDEIPLVAKSAAKQIKVRKLNILRTFFRQVELVRREALS